MWSLDVQKDLFWTYLGHILRTYFDSKVDVKDQDLLHFSSGSCGWSTVLMKMQSVGRSCQTVFKTFIRSLTHSLHCTVFAGL